MNKKILGLDLGTNSIGWAVIEQDFEHKSGQILGLGSRIIPMTQDIKNEFGKGNSISQTADRAQYRSKRRLRERHLLRRERLHRVLNILNFLPPHYAEQIDFTNRLGQFHKESEPKIAYHLNEFLFKESFQEMLADFRKHNPSFLQNKKGEHTLVPYDWTIYYLRKKALHQKIKKEELAWILLNFNQKRGYYQLRGEEVDEKPNKLVAFHSLKITEVTKDDSPNKKGEFWYSLHLENGWIYRRSSKLDLADWKDKTKDFIVTTETDEDGHEKLDKEGQIKRSFRAPEANDWTLIKKKTEQDIAHSHQTVGAYIYDSILLNPRQKIKGKLVRTIERKFYKEELQAILAKQSELHSELRDESTLSDCIRELYKHNETHQQFLNSKDFNHLLIHDILFYQRPLRSQKSTISNCSLEFRSYFDQKGQEITKTLKVIPKSNPFFQEFRLLQWLQNLSFYKNENDLDCTQELIKSIEDKENLFAFLNQKKEIDQKSLLKFLLGENGFKGKALTNEIEKYRWNYVQDKTYPCNETRAMLSARLEKVKDVSINFLDESTEYMLWHLIYSVTDKLEYEKALVTFAERYHLDAVSFVEAFRKMPPFKSDYGSFSQKAIQNLLPLMRFGKYWDIDKIPQNRIENLIHGVVDPKIPDQVREKLQHLVHEHDFQNLPLWLAQYVVYGRHSEAATAGKWYQVKDLDAYLQSFKQHTLRNPIVEQVITETLRVVRDIWVKYGNGSNNFLDEIHIELGREMKNTAEERKRLTKVVSENENTNLRIKLLLAELATDERIQNVRPYSPMQQEILKIYEDGVLGAEIEIDEAILKISQSPQPSSADLKKYKLWLEQKYKSPYTGEIIPLHKLFTSEYEIEHIIPQSRFFDDSFNNKVICESAVNKLKDQAIGLAFIKACHGQIVDCGMGKRVKILEPDAYEDFVKKHYSKNRSKLNRLMMENIPEKMITRQLNDTRYISKYISNLLSNIVREEQNDGGINSKNIISGNGRITATLRNDWGMGDVWNSLILPRFERMNKLTNSTDFTAWNQNHQKYLPTVPIYLSKGFSKKRIDHRHHALDALVLACTTRDHINLLNNESASSTKRYDLNRKLRQFEKVTYVDAKTNKVIEREIPKHFLKPWDSFTVDAKNQLETVIVSFKQNLRVINKATNYYESYKDAQGQIRLDKAGKPLIGKMSQKGANWAIRKSLHKETVSGKVTIQGVHVAKGKILTATRKSLDTSFTQKTIDAITDSGIRKILTKYLTCKKNDPNVAFSPEGIEDLNQNMPLYNDGKAHQPIYKVRIYEQGSKFALGETGNKTKKFVEADKGTNLFFAIYQKQDGKRSFESIPLNIVVERQKQGLSPVPEQNDKEEKLLFTLSPNDLVYVPMQEESNKNFNITNYSAMHVNRIYKMVSCTGSECHFIKASLSSLIKNYDNKTKIGEMGSLNKLEVMIDEEVRIKEKCYKLTVNRLGDLLNI
jgi:CRISPR-associated endonuclease Csn1